MLNDLSFFSGKRILVTGHTGFKGSWLCRMLVSAGAQVTGYALEPPTDPALFDLADVSRHMNSVTGDVRDLDALRRTFEQAKPELVIHLAAQPLVRESYRDPLGTYQTNVMGTVNLLECIRTSGAVRSVLNVTTDKVYLNREWVWGYREDEPLDGYDPYSNSKSCSELATHCYAKSFFGAEDAPAISTARAGNVIGGGDFAKDRIVPDCVRSAIAHTPIVLRNPYATRPYQHVLEPLTAYLMILAAQYDDKRFAGSYNVGPDECDCVTNGELAELFCHCAGDGLTWESQAEANAPHEANLLKLDCSKLKATFGWQPRWHIAQAIERTWEWSRAWLDGQSVADTMNRQIDAYLKG